MELLGDRDPEEAQRLLDPVLERMMEAVHRYEGTVNQVMGDGIMAPFGVPVAHGDHAVRACYAALRMQPPRSPDHQHGRSSHRVGPGHPTAIGAGAIESGASFPGPAGSGRAGPETCRLTADTNGGVAGPRPTRGWGSPGRTKEALG